MKNSKNGKRRGQEQAPEIDQKRRDKRDRDKADYYRGKLLAGKPLKDHQRAWLDAYEKTPRGESVIPPEPDAAPPAPEDAPTVAESPPAEDVPAPSPPAPAPAPPPERVLPPLAPLPPPPFVRPAAAQGDGKKPARWQDAYSILGDDPGTGPREAACVYIGSLWHGVLKQMADSIKEAGIEPYIDPDKLAGAIVLTVDGVLPDEFTLSPEIVAVGGSSALLVQRFLAREKIAAARNAQKIEAKHDVRPVRVEPPPPAPPVDARAPIEPPPPAPPPEPPPAPELATVIKLEPRPPVAAAGPVQVDADGAW